MLVKIKSAIDKEAWYISMIGTELELLDTNNPLYYFADMNLLLPVFKSDVEIIKNGETTTN